MPPAVTSKQIKASVQNIRKGVDVTHNAKMLSKWAILPGSDTNKEYWRCIALEKRAFESITHWFDYGAAKATLDQRLKVLDLAALLLKLFNENRTATEDMCKDFPPLISSINGLLENSSEDPAINIAACNCFDYLAQAGYSADLMSSGSLDCIFNMIRNFATDDNVLVYCIMALASLTREQEQRQRMVDNNAIELAIKLMKNNPVHLQLQTSGCCLLHQLAKVGYKCRDRVVENGVLDASLSILRKHSLHKEPILKCCSLLLFLMNNDCGFMNEFKKTDGLQYLQNIGTTLGSDSDVARLCTALLTTLKATSNYSEIANFFEDDDSATAKLKTKSTAATNTQKMGALGGLGGLGGLSALSSLLSADIKQPQQQQQPRQQQQQQQMPQDECEEVQNIYTDGAKRIPVNTDVMAELQALLKRQQQQPQQQQPQQPPERQSNPKPNKNLPMNMRMQLPFGAIIPLDPTNGDPIIIPRATRLPAQQQPPQQQQPPPQQPQTQQAPTSAAQPSKTEAEGLVNNILQGVSNQVEPTRLELFTKLLETMGSSNAADALAAITGEKAAKGDIDVSKLMDLFTGSTGQTPTSSTVPSTNEDALTFTINTNNQGATTAANNIATATANAIKLQSSQPAQPSQPLSIQEYVRRETAKREEEERLAKVKKMQAEHPEVTIEEEAEAPPQEGSASFSSLPIKEDKAATLFVPKASNMMTSFKLPQQENIPLPTQKSSKSSKGKFCTNFGGGGMNNYLQQQTGVSPNNASSNNHTEGQKPAKPSPFDDIEQIYVCTPLDIPNLTEDLTNGLAQKLDGLKSLFSMEEPLTSLQKTMETAVPNTKQTHASSDKSSTLRIPLPMKFAGCGFPPDDNHQAQGGGGSSISSITGRKTESESDKRSISLLKTEIAVLQKELAQQRQCAEELQVAQKENQSLQQTVKKLETKLKGQEEECNRAKSMLTKEQETSAALKKQMDNQKANSENMKTKSKESTEKLEVLKKEKKDWNKQKQNLEARVNTLKYEKSVVESELTCLKKQQSTHEMEYMKQQLEDLQKEVTRLQKEATQCKRTHLNVNTRSTQPGNNNIHDRVDASQSHEVNNNTKPSNSNKKEKGKKHGNNNNNNSSNGTINNTTDDKKLPQPTQITPQHVQQLKRHNPPRRNQQQHQHQQHQQHQQQQQQHQQQQQPQQQQQQQPEPVSSPLTPVSSSSGGLSFAEHNNLLVTNGALAGSIAPPSPDHSHSHYDTTTAIVNNTTTLPDGIPMIPLHFSNRLELGSDTTKEQDIKAVGPRKLALSSTDAPVDYFASQSEGSSEYVQHLLSGIASEQQQQQQSHTHPPRFQPPEVAWNLTHLGQILGDV